MAISTPYIYVPCYTGNIVIKLNTSDGSFVTSSGSSLTGVICSAVDINGYVWSIGLNGYLYKATLDLGSLWTYNNSKPAAFSCCLDKDGKIWTANGGDGTGNTVTKIDTDGTVLATYTVETFAYGITADCNGYVWCTNSTSNSVSRIKVSDGTVDNFALTSGDSPKQLCADLDGNILICCFGNNVVRKVNGSTGSVTASYTTRAGCYAIALDSNNNMFVTNYTHGSVIKLNTSGTEIAVYGSVGALGVAIDSDDNVWVSATDGSAVRKYPNDLSGITGAYATGTNPAYLDTGYAYQHFVLKSDAPVVSAFVPQIIFM
jgi:streptogramin lyase